MDYPSFIEDTAYINMDANVSETEQLRAILNNLTRIHLLSANRFDNFDDLIREYLASGTEVFGLETGIVSQIEENSYRVCDVISPLDVLKKDQMFELEETYCREVVKSQQVLGFPRVGELDYMNRHPVYQNLKLESYLSAPIFVDKTLFGTLNFTSVKAREFGFSIHERNLIVLMANSIGAFILLRSNEEKLIKANQKMRRVLGYVAHDLRNPLGAIIGLAKMVNKPGVPIERIQKIAQKISLPAETALEFVNTILENEALSTGKLNLAKQLLDVPHLLEDAYGAVSFFAEESQVKWVFDISDAPTIKGDPKRLLQMLTNLFINAIKYSPRLGTINCKAYSDKNNVLIEITNDKNSPEQHANSDDKKVYGSVGFGLDIVTEILTAHAAAFKVKQDDKFYQTVLTFKEESEELLH